MDPIVILNLLLLACVGGICAYPFIRVGCNCSAPTLTDDLLVGVDLGYGTKSE